jgi:hypothetical protein
MAEKKITYFDKPGRANTQACVDIVKEAVSKDGYKHIVAASTTGDTGLMLSEALNGSNTNLIVVTHSTGFKEPNHHEMSGEVRKKIKANGAEVFTGSMLTHSLEVAFSKKFSGSYLTQIVANSLRRFGEGAKVCCECVMMAVDAGLIPEDENVLAVAGTARGADTVMLIRSAASKRFLELRVLEILAKPGV